MKSKLSSPPILAYPDPSGLEFILDTDCSNSALGAVISQVQNGHEKVIAYYSPTLSKSEINYSELKYGVSSRQCNVISDDKSKVSNPNSWINGLFDSEIKCAQRKNKNLALIINLMENSDHKPTWHEICSESIVVKALWSQWKRLEIRNNILYRRWEDDTGKKISWQLVVPDSFKTDILTNLHDAVTAGHLGVNKTLGRIRERFYWTGVGENVKEWCRRCHQCGSRKRPPKTFRAPMKTYNVGAVMERVAMDIMGPLPLSEHQKNWDVLLPLQMMAYRSAEHDTTKYSPNVMLFGRDVRYLIDVLYGTVSNNENFDNLPDYVMQIRTYLDNVHEFAREKINNASDKQKWYYDYKVNFKPYSVGDAVWLHDPKRKVGISPKLQCNWDGPYLILNSISDLVYRIQKLESSKPRVVHYNRLKPYHGDFDNWLTKTVIQKDTESHATANEENNIESDIELSENEQCDMSNFPTDNIEYGRGNRVKRPPNRFVPD
ncbi:unnamed protein product [Mytilus coruscus]|uniref:Integrase zinc-binding domain-containing protein n=1 Tax=Mytilus coruscus TaxID=42192 RepID=A0A6J8BEC7_MYTCO|nr:unnamed protein product [Mytilus coruscus]